MQEDRECQSRAAGCAGVGSHCVAVGVLGRLLYKTIFDWRVQRRQSTWRWGCRKYFDRKKANVKYLKKGHLDMSNSKEVSEPEEVDRGENGGK